jgi:hypothetical protein
MKTRLVGLLVVAALAGLPSPARAQSVTVREIVRVVRASRAAATDLAEARIGTEVGTGGRVRTGGRSAAGLRFPDRSLLRLGELTEVVVTNPDRRDVRVNRGKVFGNYNQPGTITGGHAVAAVRGTKVEYLEDGRQDHVRCYGGRIYVGAADNPVYADATDRVTANTLTDPALAGLEIDWTGGEVRFTAGPYFGQVREITAFDGATGVVTFAPELAPLAAGVSEFVLSRLRGRRVVELVRNTGTTIREGQDPSPPYHVPGEQFAGVDRRPWFQTLADGRALYVFPGTADHDRMRDEYFGSRLNIQRMAQSRLLDDCDCEIIVTRPPRLPTDDDQLRSAAHRHGKQFGVRDRLARQLDRDAGGASSRPGTLLALDAAPGGGAPGGAAAPRTAMSGGGPGSGALGAGALGPALAQAATTAPDPAETGRLPTPEQIFLPQQVRRPTTLDVGRNAQFRVEPFALGSDRSDALGSRVRFQGTTGELFLEGGYLYSLLDGRSDHRLSEAFMHLRGRYGDFIAGRQHLFTRLSNNQDLGALLGLDTTDAFVYQLPLPGGFRQMAGYIHDSKAIDDGSFPTGRPGGFARGQAPLFGGLAGYTLFGSQELPRVGFSFDAAYPAVRNVLDVYGEAGRDGEGRKLFTGGIYIPALYHAAKLDVFLEFAHREAIQDRFSLRVRRELGAGLLLVGFVERISKDGFTGGGGIVWSTTFR